jgi:hypothetical protein
MSRLVYMKIDQSDFKTSWPKTAESTFKKSAIYSWSDKHYRFKITQMKSIEMNVILTCFFSL